MYQRKLGKNGLVVSAMGLGCMGMSAWYGPTVEAEGIEVVKEAYRLGVTFFDTADFYANGANELLLGKAIKGFRDDVVIATKCALGWAGDKIQVNNKPEYIRACCEASLKRLGISTIDLYYLHRYNPETPIEESMKMMLKLIEEGKIRYVGLSEVDGDIVKRAHTVLGDRLIAVQSEYSLMNRKSTEIVIPICRQLGIGLVPYSPLVRGMLSGHVPDAKALANGPELDFRSTLPQFQPDAYKANMRLVEALTKIAEAKGCTAAQISLAWVLAQGNDMVPIPGTKKLKYLRENIAAVDIKLTPHDLAAIDGAVHEHAPVGTRYPAAQIQASYLKF